MKTSWQKTTKISIGAGTFFLTMSLFLVKIFLYNFEKSKKHFRNIYFYINYIDNSQVFNFYTILIIIKIIPYSVYLAIKYLKIVFLSIFPIFKIRIFSITDALG